MAQGESARLVVGPFNRVEGDLEVHLDLGPDGDRVQSARVVSPLYRGFERMLEGREPSDALTITPRICGICSISQSAAAARALGAAMGLVPTPQGAAMAALIHAVENVSDHLFHFNLFFMPDVTRACYAARPWYPRAVDRFTAATGGAQRAAIEARAKLMHILGLMAGKWPHTLALQPGGVTRTPGPADKVRIRASLAGFRRYLEAQVFGGRLEDFAALSTVEGLMAWGRGDVGLFLEIAADTGMAGMGQGASGQGPLGQGGARYLSFGAYALEGGFGFAPGVWEGGAITPVDPGQIAEDLSHAWMQGSTAHPYQGVTRPDEAMRGEGYSWCKAPRLGGRPAEVGALARQVVDGHPLARALAEGGAFGGGGVLARVAARLLELARVQGLMEAWADAIDPGAHFMHHGRLADHAQGAGLVEAARGALGHWLVVEGGRIARYQIIAPTTWNFSPRDAGGVPGPLEAALVGAEVSPGEDTPVSVQHIVRSFDPCMVCTVH